MCAQRQSDKTRESIYFLQSWEGKLRNLKKTFIYLTSKLASRKNRDEITGMKEILEIIVVKAGGRQKLE